MRQRVRGLFARHTGWRRGDGWAPPVCSVAVVVREAANRRSMQALQRTEGQQPRRSVAQWQSGRTLVISGGRTVRPSWRGPLVPGRGD